MLHFNNMHPRITLSVGNFFFAISSILTAYILFPYLDTFMSAQYAGLVISGGAVIALILFVFIPHAIKKYGAQTLAVFLGIAQMITLFALSARPNATGAVIFIATLIILGPLLTYTLDILLEATVAKEGVTGRVRTLFLTAYNVAMVGTPLLMGSLLNTTNAYSRIFIASAAAIAPFIILFAVHKIPSGKAPKIMRLSEALSVLRHDRNLSAVTIAHFLLYLFYAWAPLYVPVYLHTTLHIPWSQLGWMFSIMLIPFVLIEYPAGVIADRILGDKELMVLGFIIMGSAFASFSFITKSSSIFFIVTLLVASRIGAALVESMTEAHFFRAVSEADTEMIALYRMAWPFADIVAPLIGSALLFTGGFSWFFIVTGGLLIFIGMGSAVAIRDFQ
ncbi:MAG TPA: MFS transporter [Candidatus Kaiserbacteria bacterium]|nr:MFS transporter [Candidatus Kaiserbacteria bacterium]